MGWGEGRETKSVGRVGGRKQARGDGVLQSGLATGTASTVGNLIHLILEIVVALNTTHTASYTSSLGVGSVWGAYCC